MSDDKPTREQIASAAAHDPRACNDGCRDERHGDQAPTEDELRIAKLERLLQDCREWMWSNPPANGWGGLDHGADAERRALLARIRAVVG